MVVVVVRLVAHFGSSYKQFVSWFSAVFSFCDQLVAHRARSFHLCCKLWVCIGVWTWGGGPASGDFDSVRMAEADHCYWWLQTKVFRISMVLEVKERL